jgi:hypothetical protein
MSPGRTVRQVGVAVVLARANFYPLLIIVPSAVVVIAISRISEARREGRSGGCAVAALVSALVFFALLAAVVAWYLSHFQLTGM